MTDLSATQTPVQSSFLKAMFMWLCPTLYRICAWLASPCERMRVRQARAYWTLGIGYAIGCRTFAEYLESIPRPSRDILADDPGDPYLVLEEPRPPLTILCSLAGVKYDHPEDFFEPRGRRYTEPSEPRWIRLNDGRKNHYRPTVECREWLVPDRLGLTARQAICAFIQYPGIVTEASDPDGHAMELIGSIHPHRPDSMATFGILWSVPSLTFYFVETVFSRDRIPRVGWVGSGRAGWKESGMASRPVT